MANTNNCVNTNTIKIQNSSIAPKCSLIHLHDDSSHAADAFRTFADAIERGLVSPNRGYESHSGRLGRMDRVVEDYLD